MSQPLSANLIISHYRIVSKIGEGGMGEVWLAEDTRLGRKVALKLLPAEFTEDSERVRRFTQEAKAASALNHPNIISVYDIGESETGRFIVMEFVAGHTLRSVIAKDNSLETLFTLGTQMARALSAAHAAGITHRDIKPDNIMVRLDGYVKMLDFGLARLLPTTSSDPEAMTLAQQTTPGTVMGTLAYMSPEQASGQSVGSPSDVFALGIVLYELATGSHPFKSETMIGYLHAITSQVPPSMTSLKSHLPPALDDLISRMLEKDARQRPTASEVAQALQEIEKYGSSKTLPFRIIADKPKVTREEEGFWVAVLPFKYRGTDADLEALAEGLSEDILTGLSRFSYLRVIARGSTLSYAGEAADVRRVGKELGARYIMEGSLRVAGSVLRVSVQLVDATSGSHLWAETYNRTFTPEQLFALQDDLVPRVVSTVADMHGVLPRSMSEAVRLKPADQITPYEALLYSFGYNERFTPDALAEARTCLERAVEQSPANADCWAMLSLMYSNEFGHWHIHTPDSAEKALKAARTAVQLAPLHSLPYYALAQALFFRKEFPAFRVAAERAVTLSPMDGATAAFMGLLVSYAGDWDRGCALAERGLQLNPNQPGWYAYTAWHDAYRKQDYELALELALKLNAPDNFYTHAVLAMCYAQLGQMEAARKAVRDLLALKPDYPQMARQLHAKWIQPDLVEELMEGLQKAGLEIANGEKLTTSAPLASPSGEIQSDEGFWVAVLPFKSSGAAAELKALAEGLSEDIVTGLSRFSYLRVIARNSTLDYDGNSSDVKTIGQTIGARYVMEGSLRQSGMKLRLAVQLVDTTTGAHLWAENYERSFSPETIFELQDDLVPRVVSTVADQYGALVHSMSESLRGRRAGQYSAHEAMLRAFGYWERMTPAEHAEVRDILEAAVAVAPDHSDCLAALAMIYWHEYAFGYNLRPDPLGRARAAAQRAVASAPSSHFAHCALATGLFFQKDYLAFRPAAERALTLNRMDSSTAAILGNMIAYAGDWEDGLGIVERAMQLNPHHAGWYHYVAFCDAYRKRDYRGALASALKVNMPAYHWPYVYLAAVYGQLGEQQRARTVLRELDALVPNFGTIAREEFGKWLDAELTEHLLDGLRKAGLEIDENRPGEASSVLHSSGAKRADEGFWVAVLPFKFTGSNVEVATLAEGLSEEIVTGLSRFSYLRVISRSSTLRYATETSDVRTVGKTLGARYVLEGSLRIAGTSLRVSVQLVDSTTGAHLWVETYNRSFNSEAIFELQDDLASRIVSTAADRHGVLPHTMSEALRNRDFEDLSPYEVLLRGYGYFERISSSEHAALRTALERVVEQAPTSDSWAMLAIIYCDEHRFGFNPLPHSLGRALTAAQRAVEAAVSNSFANEALAQALFFRKEFDQFRNAADRAISLNPLDGATTAFMGLLISYSGDWDRGCEIAQRTMQINPHHPGWYWSAAFWNAYRKRDYRAALSTALKFNMPGFFYHHFNLAIAYGQLGEREAANKALRDLLGLKPDFASNARQELGKWVDAELVEHAVEGLRKAGLDITDQPTTLTSSSPSIASSETRTDEGFWVAVLPFKFTGSNTEVAILAEGLSEEIVTGLSRFSYLRVISRSSTLRYAKETDDVRDVGKALGARYVMEGSLRVAGSSLRTSVQLVDAGTGAHLWAETYDRQFRAEEVFALQDDLVPRIVSTIADVNGVLPRSMCDVVCSKNPDELSPYEAVLRSFRYFDRVNAEELAAAQSCLEIAVKKAPTNADAWAMLALLFAQDYGQGFNLHPDSLNSGAMAAQRAVEAGPSNHLAYFSLAQARFFQKDIQSFRNAAERTVALNPMDANSLAFMGELLTYVGDSERGLALAARAKEINPNHPGWFWYADYFHAYRQGDYRSALSLILKANLPGHWGMHAGIAAVNGQLGELEAASKALGDLLKLRPDYGATVHSTLAKWFDPELCEQLLDGLRKAGLEVADEVSEPPDNRQMDASTAFPSFEIRRAIAVLPFVNISNERENEYFCDGLAEELLNALSKIESLQVAARTSAFYFKGKQANISEIGSRLNVSTVLEGSVRQSANRVRISVQLVNVADGYHLWSEKYDREMKDIFDVQDEISLAIVDALRVKLLGTEKQAVVKRYTENTAAYQLYLKGRFFVNQRTSESLLKAIGYFNQAIELDANYVLGYAGLADAYMVLGVPDAVTEALSPLESLTKARAAAEKALQLDTSVSEAYAALAHIKWKGRDWAGAEHDYLRSIELNPHNPIAHFYYAVCLAGLGRRDEAVKEIRRAQELDPLSLPVNASVVYVLYLCRRYDEAIEAGKKTLELDATFPLTHQRLGLPYIQKKMYSEAINEFQQAVNNSNRAPQPLVSLGHAYAVSGKTVEARKVLAELKDLSQRSYVSPYGVAAIYVGLGEKEPSFDWLEKAFDEDSTELTFLKVDPRLDPLREDQRFQALLDRAGFPR